MISFEPNHPFMNSPLVKSPPHLIRYVEIWQSDATKTRLDFQTALEIGVDEARVVKCGERSEAAGEGIAGSAWKQKSAVVIRDHEAVVLRDACQRCGFELNALIAIPFVDDTNRVTVVVFGIGEGYGGFEIWAKDDRDELSINGSYYSGLDSFEFISQYVRFPRGSGLPGASWKLRQPKMVLNPGVDASFIRSFAKDPAELTACVGIPVMCDYASDGSALLLLSSTQQPVASRIDILSCESPAPSKDQPKPSVKYVAAHSTPAETNGAPTVFQAVCDQLSQSRSVLLLREGARGLQPGTNASVVIPFFDGRQLKTALQISF